MRIDILVPVATDFRNDDILQAALAIPHTVDIGIANIERGALSIENEYDEAISTPYIVELAEKLEREGSSGVIVYCFQQPGAAACKEALGIPVVSLSESAIAMASLMGQCIGVIPPMDCSSRAFARRLGDKVAHYCALNIPVLDYENLELLMEALEDRIQKLLDKGCDVIVLGCGSILGMDINSLQEKYNVPIVEPLHAAVAACEYMAQCNLRQSKRTFAFPLSKEVK